MLLGERFLLMLTVERTLSSTSRDTQYFDAPEMSFLLSNGKGSSNHRASTTNYPTDTQGPNGGIRSTKGTNAHHEQPDTSPTGTFDHADHGTPSLESLPVFTGSRDDEVPLTGSMGGGRNASVARKVSARTAKSTRSVTEATAAFQNGSALAGPNAEPDVDVDVIRRGAIAERSLSTKQKHKINKDERERSQVHGGFMTEAHVIIEQDSKRLSKLLQTESKLEKAALTRALKSLAALQDLHKSACKREEKVEAAHCKALLAAQKAESIYYEVKAHAEEERARWEGKQAEARAQEERLEAERDTVRKMEERVAECAREVERLRIIKATDEVRAIVLFHDIAVDIFSERKRSQEGGVVRKEEIGCKVFLIIQQVYAQHSISVYMSSHSL